MGKRNSKFIINSCSFYFKMLLNCQGELKKGGGGKEIAYFKNKLVTRRSTMVNKCKVFLNL